ncbi:hypothetical protein GCM10027047_00580 [Rhodococcus aerolatus]
MRTTSSPPGAATIADSGATDLAGAEGADAKPAHDLPGHATSSRFPRSRTTHRWGRVSRVPDTVARRLRACPHPLR